MRRHVSEPWDAGRFGGGVGVESLGDGLSDNGLAFLGEELDELFLLADQVVDLGGLVVEELSD